MNKIIHAIATIFFFLIILWMSFVFGYSFYKIKEIERTTKKIQSEIEVINYKMDTLEFFKLPEEKRKWR